MRSEGSDLLPDGPDEAGEFACHGHHELVAIHAADGEFAKAGAQAQLRLPSDVEDGLGQTVLAAGNDGRDARRVRRFETIRSRFVR